MNIMSQNLRVLMFGWELPPHNTGGLGVACYGLAKGLSQYGVKIAFALPRKLQVEAPFMEVLGHNVPGMKVTAINSLLKAYMNEESFKSWANWINGSEMKMLAGSIYEEAVRFGDMATAWSRSEEHAVIHAHDWMAYPAGLKARAQSGRPFVAHIHATEYDRTGGNINTQIAELEYQGLNEADRVIAVSHYTKNMVNRYYGVPMDNIEVVHNGVDLDEFSPLKMRALFPNDKIVLFVGRLTFQKGVDYFLQAAKQVLEVEPRTIFLVVGDGDMYEKLVVDAAELGIGNRVVFPGFMAGERLKACYQMADVFVMPSVSEPYGIVALEALASGTPAVISRQSGVSESLSHVLKVDFWDTRKMSGMITSLLRYPEMAQELARQAKREAGMMTWQKAAAKTLAVYRQLL